MVKNTKLPATFSKYAGNDLTSRAAADGCQHLGLYYQPWYQFTDPEGMDGLVGHGRDRTIDRVRAQRASYHYAMSAKLGAMYQTSFSKCIAMQDSPFYRKQ
ncbi:hypothetical protein Y032_0119g823 [Ancylostoma ceylanicum]|uniref:Uncharacterized protein n=1 Tax=Ancylostoma ceylanicum TaxID=53326 RepID=A0A016TA71_9BILA|nr:hypothetical protein Y032_0119g823 [Ancylostoma ceylanicum]